MIGYYTEQIDTLTTQIELAEKGMLQEAEYWVDKTKDVLTQIDKPINERTSVIKAFCEQLKKEFKALDDLYSDRKRLEKQLDEWEAKTAATTPVTATIEEATDND